jgi:CubicO group peptidase (beta-lactamase class C family)
VINGQIDPLSAIENCLRIVAYPDGCELRNYTLAELMEYYSAPGLSVAIIGNGELVGARGYGVCESGSPDAVTEKTLFQAGSVSKLISAITVLRLAERKVLSLDCDVNDYLTSCQLRSAGDWKPTVTLAHLLSHTGGTTVPRQPGYSCSQPLPTLLQVIGGESPANTPPILATRLPGVTFQYSGGGYTIVQQVLEDVCGMPFDDIVRETVLDPLDMTNTTFAQSPADTDHRKFATAHHYGSSPVVGKYHVYVDAASAGMWTTPTDLGRVIQELLRANNGQGKLLSRESTRRMMTPVVRGGYGLGSHIDQKYGMTVFQHFGWNMGYMSVVLGSLDRPVGVVVMYNTTQGSQDLLSDIMEAIASEYGWCDTRAPQSPCLDTISEIDQHKYAGNYELTSGGIARVTTVGTRSISLQLPSQPSFPLFAEMNSSFRTPWPNIVVRFDAQDGNAPVMRIVEGGKTLIEAYLNRDACEVNPVTVDAT